MPYRTLGARSATGAADTTGNNSGNWTIAFTPSIIAVSVNIPEFEVYKIILPKAAALTATFNVYIDANLWDTNVYAHQNSWEPAGGNLIMRAGETLYLYYSSLATDGNQPKATIWLRHEVALTQAFL